MNEHLRRTGRTHRALTYAIEQASAGKEVLYLYASTAQVAMLTSMARKIKEPIAIRSEGHILTYTRPAIGAAIPGQIEFRSILHPSVDLSNWTFRGTRAELLADHYAIEHWFGQMMTELHRFDAPEARRPPNA